MAPLKNDRKFLFEISVRAPAEWAETIAGYMFELGAAAVEERIEGPTATLVTNYPMEEVNGKVAALGGFLAEIARQMKLQGEPPKVALRKVEDKSWAEEARKSFKPTHICDNYWAAPSWTPEKDMPEGVVLLIDPGEAFGTGMHPTTRQAAALMVEEISRRDRPAVIDIGSGSGILAMVARRAGAGAVAAIDTDPRAIETAMENFTLNNCTVELSYQKIESITDTYDIVVANILLETLVNIAPHLIRVAGKNGAIILAGLLTEQGSEMKERMADLGIGTPEEELAEDGWLALRYRL